MARMLCYLHFLPSFSYFATIHGWANPFMLGLDVTKPYSYVHFYEIYVCTSLIFFNVKCFTSIPNA